MRKLFKVTALLATLAGSIVWSSDTYAVACTSIATGNWNAQSTWGAAGIGCVGATGGIPGAADTVTIASPNVVTANVAISVGAVTINTGATLNIAGSNWTVNGATSISGTLGHTNTGGNEIYIGLVTINSGGTWNNAIGESMVFRGGLTNNGTFTGGAAGTCTFNTNAQSIGGANPITMPNLTVSGGITLTNTGTLTVTTALSAGGGGGGTFLNSANATLNIGGTSGITTLTASAIGNTVNYTGAAQTLKLPSGAPATYYNLGLDGSGAKTMPATAMTVAGNFTMSGTATTTASQALTVGGNFTIGATNTFAASTFSHSVAGNWINNGTFTANTSTVTFTGTLPQTIGGAVSTTFNNLTVANTGTGTTTLLINTSVAGNLSMNSGTMFLSTFTANRTAAGGTITIANGATLDIGGTNTFPANYTTHTIGATSTVVYSGTNQTVAAEAAPGYGNLTLSGSGTKTAAGSFITRGNLSIASGVTLASSTFTQTVNGNVTNDGTQTATTGSITLSGGAATHTLSGNGIYGNLVLNDVLGTTLAGSPSVSGVLTLTSGIITTGADILKVTSNCTTGIAGAGATAYVLGNLTLHYPTLNPGTTTCTFPIGTAGVYAPAAVAMVNVSSTLANSSLTARTDAGDHADTTANASGINPARSVNRYWTLTAGGSLTFATYSTTFTFVAGDIDGGAATASFIIARKSGGIWSYPTMGARNPLNTTASGMTQAGGFGEFVIGERILPSLTILKTVGIISDPVNGVSSPKYIPGAVAEYTVIASNANGPADYNSTFISDPVPANTSLYVNDVGGAGSGPVLFTQGATTSTLTYTFTALGDMADDLSFSNDGGATWTAVPSADGLGCDATVPAITHIRANPKGAFIGSVGPNPSFQLKFRVCVK